MTRDFDIFDSLNGSGEPVLSTIDRKVVIADSKNENAPYGMK
jgi:hypothetical protein